MPVIKNIFHIQFTPKWFPVVFFGFLIFTYNFQNFLNFLLPVSLKWLSIAFSCYACITIFIGLFNRIYLNKFDWLFTGYFVFLLYSIILMMKNLQAQTIVGFININLPFISYFFIKIIKYEHKLEFLFKLNVFFLSIVVFYGIYEYFFAQCFLQNICMLTGRKDALDLVLDYNQYYRSVSFIMHYVHFSYYGLLLYFIFFIRTLIKKDIFSYILLFLTFAGLCTSLGLTVIAISVFISFVYVLLIGKISQKLLMLVFMLFIISLIFYLYQNYKTEVGLFQRFDIMKEQNQSGHDFVFIKQLLEKLVFWGTGGFTMIFEQEYFDAWQRFGVIMGTIYLIISLGLYFRACRIAIKFKEMRLYSIPLALYCISNLIIGFFHHTIDNTNQSILIFSFIGMLENRYGKTANQF